MPGRGLFPHDEFLDDGIERLPIAEIIANILRDLCARAAQPSIARNGAAQPGAGDSRPFSAPPGLTSRRGTRTGAGPPAP